MDNKIVINNQKLNFVKPLVPLEKVDRIIIHHTEKFGWNVNRTHYHHINKNGWDGIGYNYFIEYDGTIQQGRGLHVGAHAYGFNFNSIGICLSGNFDYEFLAVEMEESAYRICLYFMKKYNLSFKDVYGHLECNSDKTCPGLNINMDNFREKLKEYHLNNMN